eukprot:CAMPEP_0196591436 /NCGR_PEP_ID=MMETSP1081-20130531/69605_1 /TAXON_ID=36882 /ORGANISM="Pyramimonas amylifera, Strain CCMP720" /LENGTH=191 /DNA_ID=CAMNT_0041914797 /DNA_START=232 /DNA_END=807 /DNA_ORIENTATION=+
MFSGVKNEIPSQGFASQNTSFDIFTSTHEHRHQRNHVFAKPLVFQRGLAGEVSLAHPTDFDMLRKEENFTSIDGYGKDGFLINNVEYWCSVMCSNKIAFQWKIVSPKDITVESLALVHLLDPTPDIVIIGTGARMCQISPEVSEHFKQAGIALDIMSTVNASPTFNILNQEGRIVVGALLPNIDFEKQDVE